jgi:uncharacterized delta-60 repeat protein
MEARKHLLIVRQDQGRFGEAVAIGLEALGELRVVDEPSFRVARSLVIALHFAGRYGEELVLLDEICRWKGQPDFEAHQTACCLARLGRPVEAIEALSRHLDPLEKPDPMLLFDGDLALLWEQLESTDMPLETAHLLRAPRFDALERWPEPDLYEGRYSWADFDDFDPGWREVIHVRDGALRLNAEATRRDPAASARWHGEARARLRAVRGRIAAVRAAALRQVVQAQPAYAAWHLCRGNHNAARCRVLFALAHDIRLLDSMRRNPGLAALAPVLEEVAWFRACAPELLDTAVLARYRQPEPDSDQLWLTLHHAPAHMKKTNLWKLLMVGLLADEGDLPQAVPLWFALAEAWPKDAFAMGSLARALVLAGRFEAAAEALAHAPESFADFWLHDDLHAAIRNRRNFLTAPGCSYETISAPDLGCSLKPEATPPESCVPRKRSPLFASCRRRTTRCAHPLREINRQPKKRCANSIGSVPRPPMKTNTLSTGIRTFVAARRPRILALLICAAFAPLCHPANAAPGDLDLTFGGAGKVTMDVTMTGAAGYYDLGQGIVLQNDGKLLVCGISSGQFGLVRYNPDGNRDLYFGAVGMVRPETFAYATESSLALQTDGRILLAGTSYRQGPRLSDLVLIRYNANGSVDTTFNGTGSVRRAFFFDIEYRFRSCAAGRRKNCRCRFPVSVRWQRRLRAVTF